MTDRTITLSAAGTVSAVPDIVRISLGVMTDAAEAKAALTANTQAMTQVIDALKQQGLEPRDVQTSDFAVQPRYEYTQDGKPPRLAGYTVSNQVSIRVRDIAKLGTILDLVVGLGSNQINGIQYEVSNAETLRDQSRKAAIANAQRMAGVYAEAAGVKLGPVLRIEEGAVYAGPRPMMRTAMAEATAAPVPIEAGEQAIDVQVTVTWALQ